ncbi:MAG: YbjN domain-containing protein [Caldilineaceae bacterium]
MINIPNYFKRYAWTYEEVDAQIWRTTFTTEQEDEFDLYVMLGEEFVHFAVSPFLSKLEPDQQSRVYKALLSLNQQMRLVYFAVDEEEDVNLLAELPVRGFSYTQFEMAMNVLIHYTQTLAHDLGRIANEPNFRSPLIGNE